MLWDVSAFSELIHSRIEVFFKKSHRKLSRVSDTPKHIKKCQRVYPPHLKPLKNSGGVFVGVYHQCHTTRKR